MMEIPRHQVATPASQSEGSAADTPEQRSAARRRSALAWASKHFDERERYVAAMVALSLRRRLGRTPTADEVRAYPNFARLLGRDAGRGGASSPPASSPGAAGRPHQPGRAATPPERPGQRPEVAS